jgi:hypothetical protein
MRKLAYAVAVLGPENLTRISTIYDHLNTETVERMAAVVRRKKPGRAYYIVQVDPSTGGSNWKEQLMVWNVGEGFTHAEGWWVEMGE